MPWHTEMKPPVATVSWYQSHLSISTIFFVYYYITLNLAVGFFLEAWPSNIFYFSVYTYRQLHKDTNWLAVSQAHTLKKMLKTVP